MSVLLPYWFRLGFRLGLGQFINGMSQGNEVFKHFLLDREDFFELAPLGLESQGEMSEVRRLAAVLLLSGEA